MIRQSLMLGLSTVAMTVGLAGAASAQNSQTGCSAGGVNGNVCTVTQTPGQSNTSTVTVTSGTGNNVTVNQTGTAVVSVVQIAGSTNTVNHQQAGVLDNASSTITGNNNNVSLSQGANGSFNTATVTLTGNSNVVEFVQGGNTNGSSRNNANILIGGNSNSLRARIRQDNVLGPVVPVATSNNTANLNMASGGSAAAATVYNQDGFIGQDQSGNSATTVIRGGNTTLNGQTGSGINQSYTFQLNQLYQGAAGGGFTPGTPTASNNPNTGNVSDISVAGEANNVRNIQDGVQNFLSVSVNRGRAAQANAVAGANFAAGRTGGNFVNEIRQAGQNNRINISVGGRDAAGQQGLGNQFSANQGVFGGGTAGRGTDHSATVFQFGQLSQITLNQQDNTATVNSTDRQGGSVADVSQSSFFSTITLTQNGGNNATLSQGGGSSVNNSLIVSQTDLGSFATAGSPGGGPFNPGTPGGTTAARNSVVVSQAGGALGVAGDDGIARGNRINVDQSGLAHSATVFQRLGSLGSRAFIAQGTGGALAAGDTAPAFFADAQAAAPNASGVNQNATANVDQGARGTVNIRQDGGALSASIQQNSINNATAAAVASVPIVNISQAGQNQSATVNQFGSASSVTVDQRNGSAAASTNTQTSVIQITQGTAGAPLTASRAIARQTGTGSGVSAAGSAATGPAGDVDARAAGSYANRIEIGQTGTSNLYAEVEQQGAGQLARITQSGMMNTAQIFQGAAATNAIAIIAQSGTGNSFVINQTAANQFFRISQTGSNNQTFTGSGTGGGNTGGVPVFSTTPN